MPHPAIYQDPVIMYYPRAEASSSGGPKHATASSLFADTYICKEMLTTFALMAIDAPVFLGSLVAGSIKPIKDYFQSHAVAKKATSDHIQMDMGDVMVSSSSDPYCERKIGYYFMSFIPVIVAAALKENAPIATHAITTLLGCKMGYQLAQRSITYLNPPPKK